MNSFEFRTLVNVPFAEADYPSDADFHIDSAATKESVQRCSMNLVIGSQCAPVSSPLDQCVKPVPIFFDEAGAAHTNHQECGVEHVGKGICISRRSSRGREGRGTAKR